MGFSAGFVAGADAGGDEICISASPINPVARRPTREFSSEISEACVLGMKKIML